MNKIKKPILLAITLVIAGLAIAVSANAAIQTQTPNEQTFFVNKNPNVNIAGMDIGPSAGVKNIVIKQQGKSAVPVFPGYHPAVASDSLGYVVLGFEDDTPNVWFTASNDGGQNWVGDAVAWQIEPPPELPDVDSCGDGRFIGGMVPNWDASSGSELYKVQVTDPMELETGYECLYWVWQNVGSGYTNFDAIAVAGYTAEDPDENTWAFGGHTIIGDHPESGTNTPFFSYQFDSTGYAWIYRWTGLNGSTSTSHDIDPGNLYSYAAWNFDNAGDKDIYIAVFDFGTWEPYSGYVIHPDVTDLTIEATGNDEYIDISALNDNIIVVSQRAGDIVAYYSTDGMNTVAESLIETSAVNPRIVHTGDLKATCIFIKEGSVYYSTTGDGGATWSTPEIIDEPENTNVPGEYKAADVCGYGAAWMNSDDGNIYFASVGGNNPPNKPTINGPTKLKPNRNYDFTFTSTDPNGDDIYYYVDWGDGTNSGWQGPYSSGYELKLTHKWTTKDKFTIKCKAKDTYDLQSGWATLEVSTPRVVTRPMLLQRLLERFPHAFPILRYILGV
ncbi:MAG: hypothetical protein QHH19_01195 [Candidatus Thermoplasmatota archaeon]|jgi:hypothetical protein|nr:hypothetical protein [Candidatus Thermoplasmatota archaeon]